MKSLLVLSRYWPAKESSITGIFVVDQIAALGRAGYRTTVVVPRPLGKGVRFRRPEELSLDPEAVELAHPRTGRNGRHGLPGLLRQSVFSRLAGDASLLAAEGRASSSTYFKSLRESVSGGIARIVGHSA